MYSILFLFISLGISDCQEWVVSENKMNWRDAVGFCQERNGTLILHSTAELSDNVTDYWTAKQQRMSPWIHSIGCFNETVIQPLLNSSVTYRSPSVVHCQQRCSGFSSFGLQNSCCVCLQEFPYTDAIDSSLCNIPCSESPNVVLGECGGPKTYSIYKPEDNAFYGEENDNNTCLAITCEDDDQVQRLSCTTNIGIRCRCAGDGDCTPGNIFDLDTCFKDCKSHGKYLYYGDYDVHDRIQPSSLMNIAWTGISKQIFISSNVDSIHSNSILLQCFNCNRDGCSFGNCLERRHAICNKHQPETYTSSTSSSTTSLTSVSSSEQPPEQPSIAPPISSTATQSSTSLSSQSSATNTTMISFTESSTSTAGKTSTVTPSSLENYQDHGIKTQTIVAVVISLVAVSIFVGVTFFCIRKKICHHKDQDGPRSRDERELVTYDEIQLTEPKLNTNGIVVNDNYSVLEPEQKSIKQEILQDNECYDHLGDVDKEKGYTNSHLYTNTIEFTAEQNNSGDDESQLYNHLWEKSSGPVEDLDIYSHMPPEDDYEYSTAEREDLNRTSNYDHVVLNENNSFEIVRNGNDPCEI